MADILQFPIEAPGLKEFVDGMEKATDATGLLEKEQAKLQKTLTSTKTPAEKLQAQITALEASTSDATKGTELYNETLKALQAKGLKLAEDATRKLAREQEKLATEGFERSAKRADAYGKALEALNIPGASYFKRQKDLNEALKDMTINGNAADVKAIKLASTMGSLVTAAGAAAIGVTALASAAYGAITSTREWNDELTAAGRALDAEVVANADKATAAIDSAELSMKASAATAASVFAPAIETAANKLSQYAMIAGDVFKTWQKDGALAAVETYGIAVATDRYADAAVKASAAQKEAAAYARDYNRETDPLLKSILATEKAEKAAAEATRKNAAAQKELIARVKERSAAYETPTELKSLDVAKGPANGIVVPLTIDSAPAFSKLIADANVAAEATKNALANAATSIAGSAQQAFGMWADAEQKQVAESGDRIKQLQEELANATDASEKKQLRARIDNLKKKQAEDLKHAKMANALQKSAAVIGIAVNTAMAVTKAWAMFGPPPSAAGIASSIAAVVGGAIEVAAVLAQPDPSYSSGGGAMPSAPSSGGAISPTAASQAAGPVAGQGQGSIPTMTTMAEPVSRGNDYAMQVSDAYVAPSSQAMTVKTSPGDGLYAFRGGANGKGLPADPYMISLLERNNDLLEQNRQATLELARNAMYQQHRNALAPPPVKQ